MVNRLRYAIKEKYGSFEEASNALSMDRGNLSTLINKRDPRTLRIETIKKLEKAFPEYNIYWILERSDIKFKKDMQPHASKDGNGMVFPDGHKFGIDPHKEVNVKQSVTL